MRQITPVVHRPLRAAIVGASGIGRHHAKWLTALGADVIAIVGSTPESAAKTAQSLREEFGIEAAAYTQIEAMLEAEDPDIVHVCTPPALHYPHMMALAPHRCHILCEKPLTWDETKSPTQFLAEAQEIVAATAQPERVTAINLQYTAAPAAYWAFMQSLGRRREPPRTFFMRMDSRRERNVYEIIWRELAPHCLSVLTAFCGAGVIELDTAELTIAERENRAQFVYCAADGSRCEAEIVVGTVLEGPLTRRFGVNGVLVDYEGRNDEHGIFRTVLRLDDVEQMSDDFMYLSIRQWLLAVTGQADEPLATLADGLQNEEMQVGLLARGKRSSCSD